MNYLGYNFYMTKDKLVLDSELVFRKDKRRKDCYGLPRIQKRVPLKENGLYKATKLKDGSVAFILMEE